MAKIVSVVGGRPQFIKEAITGRSIRKFHQEMLVHTGQHYDVELSENLFRELGIIEPAYNLGVGSGSHAVQTAKVMIEMEKVLLKEKPDLMLVYGDMNTTMGAAITAAKMNVPVAHIEAGARIHVFDMPEEQNRIVTDHLSTWNFACTMDDYQHLFSENLGSTAVYVGDVMYDAVQHYLPKVQCMESKIWGTLQLYREKKLPLREWGFSTVHRPENTDNIQDLDVILQALHALPYPVVFAVHPRIKEKVELLLKDNSYENIVFVKPVSYLQSLYLAGNARVVVTDSGGLQRESYWMKTPCVVILRNLVDAHMRNGNCLVQAKKTTADILEKVLDTKVDTTAYDFTPYGEGRACEKIAKMLLLERSR